MQQLTLEKQQVLVVGLGMSGQSAAHFLLAHGAFVQGVDRNASLLITHPNIQTLQQAGFKIYTEKNCPAITTFDLLVLSPGVPQDHFLVQVAKQAQVPVIGEIELGCQFARNPLVGITGTNGKTTVTLLVTHILNHVNDSARALGNVAVPFTQDLLTLSPQTTIVLELSSYQLETLYQPCLDAALLLNITPDHLDRYKTMDAYAKAKCDIERCIKPGGHLYVEEKTWQQYSSFFKEKTPRLYGYLSTSFIYTDLEAVYCAEKKVFELPTSLKNKKSHDLENLLAAYALCFEKKVKGNAFLEAWHSFKKPAHRMEFIAEQQGVRYYDDSKGTNIDAVIRAVQSLNGPLILIAGGVDKGFTYTSWLEEFRNKVKLICAIGQAAAKIHEQLDCYIPVMIFNTLDQAVHYANQLAQRGDTVLLSPGCASFDMFKDYAHRGKEFQRIVHELESSSLKTTSGEKETR